jgi:hypothetical protein
MATIPCQESGGHRGGERRRDGEKEKESQFHHTQHHTQGVVCSLCKNKGLTNNKPINIDSINLYYLQGRPQERAGCSNSVPSHY